MKSKIALMAILMLTLPLAGCIDGSDVAGAVQTGGDDSTDSTTTWSNQTTYVNETQIIHQTVYMPEQDILVSSGHAGECETWQNSSDGSSTCTAQVSAERYTISVMRIPANMTAQILGGSVGAGAGYLYLNIQCDSGWRMDTVLIGATFTLNHIPSDGSGCDVTNSNAFFGSWSAIYVLHNATVI